MAFANPFVEAPLHTFHIVISHRFEIEHGLFRKLADVANRDNGSIAVGGLSLIHI